MIMVLYLAEAFLRAFGSGLAGGGNAKDRLTSACEKIILLTLKSEHRAASVAPPFHSS